MNSKMHPLHSLLILCSLILFVVDHSRLPVESYALQALLLGVLTGEARRKGFHILNLSLFVAAVCATWLHYYFLNGVSFMKMIQYWLPVYLACYLLGWGLQALVEKYLPSWRPYMHYSAMGLFYSIVLLLFNSFFFYYGTNARGAVLYWAIFAFLSGVYLYKQGWRAWQHGLVFVPFVLIVLYSILSDEWEIAKILLCLPVAIVLGMLLAYGAHRSSGRYVLYQFTGLMVLVLLGLLVTYDNLNHESFLEERSPWTHQHQLFLYEGDTITLDYFEGKVLVLDFWNTTCGVCFQKFPQLEKLHKQFENNPDVLVLAVNNPLKRDPVDKAKVMMEEQGYSFGKLYALDTGTAADFDIHFFPVVLYVKAEEGSTYIRGSLESKWHVLRNSRRVVESLL
jgi:thiol-disulfide isomerase/thioredoxin